MTHTELTALQDELAEVARSIARLLLKPGHDPADLAGLDARARELRARIRDVQEREALGVTVLRFPGNGRPPLPDLSNLIRTTVFRICESRENPDTA